MVSKAYILNSDGGQFDEVHTRKKCKRNGIWGRGALEPAMCRILVIISIPLSVRSHCLAVSHHSTSNSVPLTLFQLYPVGISWFDCPDPLRFTLVSTPSMLPALPLRPSRIISNKSHNPRPPLALCTCPRAPTKPTFCSLAANQV